MWLKLSNIYRCEGNWVCCFVSQYRQSSARNNGIFNILYDYIYMFKCKDMINPYLKIF